jgi:hypothetical protein
MPRAPATARPTARTAVRDAVAALGAARRTLGTTMAVDAAREYVMSGRHVPASWIRRRMRCPRGRTPRVTARASEPSPSPKLPRIQRGGPGARQTVVRTGRDARVRDPGLLDRHCAGREQYHGSNRGGCAAGELRGSGVQPVAQGTSRGLRLHGRGRADRGAECVLAVRPNAIGVLQ